MERLGTIRRLARLASDDGYFLVAALDHPENYLALLDPDVTRVPHETVVASKLELAAKLAEHASALLLDPVWSLGQAIATGVVPGHVGLMAPIELLTYTPKNPPGWAVEPQLRPGWTVDKIAKLGALQQALQTLIRLCQSGGALACPIIEALEASPEVS